ncbi:MIP/aquaporin family protein [Paracidobacterium acidisoli]|uniref:Aquaporin family protein n=1 Tax=Paracidobacterium acidisoli TaxID=2303751 RepID=A0A372IT37_9BACT|nr:MIP/aquaporin family protein [Paracidobacterium acidisoli]MBT9329493.1 aquaporin family protein [Paracidobacterium acidisoli]
MRCPFLGEFMGTLMLVLLGDGVNAAVLLKRSKAEGSGWMVITTGWMLAVLCGIFTAQLFGSADAHLNPAITLASAAQSGSFGHVAGFALAQMLGAFTGAVLVWLHYYPHWKITDDPELKRAVFCTGPAIRNPLTNFLSEVIGTAVLVLVAGAMSSKLVLTSGAAAGLSPWLVSCVVWGIGLSLGGTTGYAINPARDLGPRVAHALMPIAGKGSSDWGYALIPILGPATGGILAGLVLRWIGA